MELVMMNQVQQAMSMLKKIDSVPKDRTLVLYTHSKMTNEQYQSILHALGQLNEGGSVGQVIVLPHDELELKELTAEDKERLRKLLDL
jgi:hypothetical protein